MQFIRKLINKLGYEIVPFEVLNKMHFETEIDYELGIYNKLFDSTSIKEKRFYNIGGGDFYHPNWTNIDFNSDWYKWEQRSGFINHNLLEKTTLPLNDNYAEVFYTSHTIEHIQNHHAEFLFKEIYRSLKPNGFFRVVCPNIWLDYTSFLNKDFHYYKSYINHYNDKEKAVLIKLNIPLSQASIEQLFLYSFASSVSTIHSDGAEKRISDLELNQIFEKMGWEDAMNYCMNLCDIKVQKKYPGNHINWWTQEKITLFLKKAGFKKVYVSAYAQSLCPIMRNTQLFDNTGPNIQLHIEAIK
jgi:SAM-dependent methyltransferase